MRDVAPLRNAAWLTRIASLVTIVALVVAPACGPLCAARACAQAPGPAEVGSDCHSHGTANGGAVHLHAVHRCGAPELQVANVSAASARGLIQRDRVSAPADRIGAVAPGLSSPSAHNSATIGADVESPPHFCSVTSKVVLRI